MMANNAKRAEKVTQSNIEKSIVNAGNGLTASPRNPYFLLVNNKMLDQVDKVA